jgi:hypothetical protein
MENARRGGLQKIDPAEAGGPGQGEGFVRLEFVIVDSWENGSASGLIWHEGSTGDLQALCWKSMDGAVSFFELDDPFVLPRKLLTALSQQDLASVMFDNIIIFQPCRFNSQAEIGWFQQFNWRFDRERG